MATVIQGVPALLHPHIRNSFRALGSSVVAWLAERRQRAAIRRRLELLDPRDLRDLGISRYDFDAIARGEVTRAE